MSDNETPDPALEMLRRRLHSGQPELADDDLIGLADEVYVQLDREEQAS